MLHRRLFAAAAALTLSLAVVPGALGAIVHVRVEGRTQTLFGATQPRATASNALEALDSASLAGELFYHVTDASFGRYVDQVGRYGASAQSGWVFKVNGVSPPVGADQVQLKDGDTVLWYYATFGPAGGPPTLVLTKTQGRCYQVRKQDDAGTLTPAVGATLRVDGRTIRTTAAATGCPTGRHGLVRATLAGAVRSNALP